MNGNHIAYARFDGILMIDGASLAALFSRNRVATIYEDVAQQRGKPGRPGRLRRLLDTPLDTFGLSQRIVRQYLPRLQPTAYLSHGLVHCPSISA